MYIEDEVQKMIDDANWCSYPCCDCRINETCKTLRFAQALYMARHKDVEYDEEQDAYMCPKCGAYIAERWQVKDLDYLLPAYCSECGTKLHY